MPIPRRCLKPKVVGGGEMVVFHGSDELNEQHGHPHGDVEPVEAGQHKERGSVDA